MIRKKPILGHGVKSFRKVCTQQNIISVSKKKRCSTHPHNLHLEILAETGIIGYVFFITLIFLVLLKSFKVIKNKDKYERDEIYTMFISSLILVLVLLFPFKSTGRFFSTSFGFYFWLSFSIFIASNFSEIPVPRHVLHITACSLTSVCPRPLQFEQRPTEFAEKYLLSSLGQLYPPP